MTSRATLYVYIYMPSALGAPEHVCRYIYKHSSQFCGLEHKIENKKVNEKVDKRIRQKDEHQWKEKEWKKKYIHTHLYRKTNAN